MIKIKFWGQLDRIEEKNCEADNTPLRDVRNSTFRLTVQHMEVVVLVLFQCYTKENEMNLQTRKILGKKQTGCGWECTV
jgi:hypothetical protein